MKCWIIFSDSAETKDVPLFHELFYLNNYYYNYSVTKYI